MMTHKVKKKAIATKKLASKKRTKKSKLKPSDVTVKITDCSKIDSSAPMTFMYSPHGPVILKSPEQLDDLNGEPRGTTRKLLRATGLGRRRITMIGRIKVPH